MCLFSFLLYMYDVCMHVRVSPCLFLYPYFKASIHQFPNGSHALYLQPFDFGYFNPYSLIIRSSNLTNRLGKDRLGKESFDLQCNLLYGIDL